MKIHVKNTSELVVPQAASEKAAGYDVISLSIPTIKGELAVSETPDKIQTWKRIDYIEYRTGLFTSSQTDSYGHNYHTLIFPRSSVSKYNLVLANCIGLIDNDYRGEILLRFKYIWQPEDFVIEDGKIVGLVNEGKIYKQGDAIGQLVAEVTNPIDWVVVADLTQTARGTGGFGSTDIKKVVETPAEKFTTPIIDESELIRIRSAAPTIVETSEPPTRKYDVDKPFNKTGKSSIMEQYQKLVGQEGKPLGYEKLVKERENPQP